MNHIRLPRSANVRAKENPRVRTRYQARTALHIWIDSHKTDFVAAERDEKGVTHRLGSSKNTSHFQPASEPTPLFTGALPPTAAWHHENERCQRRIAPWDFGSNVIRLCGHPPDLRNQRRLRVELGLFF